MIECKTIEQMREREETIGDRPSENDSAVRISIFLAFLSDQLWIA